MGRGRARRNKHACVAGVSHMNRLRKKCKRTKEEEVVRVMYFVWLQNLALLTSDVNNKLSVLLQTNFLGRAKVNKKRTYVLKVFLNHLFFVDELLARLNSVDAIVSHASISSYCHHERYKRTRF